MARTEQNRTKQQRGRERRKQKPLASAQGLGLDREGDLDVVEILVLLKNRHHDLRSVVDSKDDIRDSSLDRAKKKEQSRKANQSEVRYCRHRV